MKKILAELKNRKRTDLIAAILKIMAESTPEPPTTLDKLNNQKNGKNKHGKLNNFVGRKNEFDDLNSSNKEYKENPEKLEKDIKTNVEASLNVKHQKPTQLG